MCRTKRERSVPYGAPGSTPGAGARQGQRRVSDEQHERPYGDDKRRPRFCKGRLKGGKYFAAAERVAQCGSRAPAGGGRFRKPASRGRRTIQGHPKKRVALRVAQCGMAQTKRDRRAAIIPQRVTARTETARRSGSRRPRGFGGRGAPANA